MDTRAAATADSPGTDRGFLDRWFEISRRGSTVGREIRGGLVTFFAMAYIIALNPLIIGTSPDKNGNLISGQPYLDAAGAPIEANLNASIAMVAAATALIAGVMTFLMGAWARYPLALAAGLGLNALVAYVIAPTMTWPQAMGMILLEGIVVLILVLTGFRAAVFRAVPRHLRAAISVGIGLFITFVGLVDGGIVRPAQGTPVQLGVSGSLVGWPVAIFVIGFILGGVLYLRKVRGALLISVIASTVLAVIVEAVGHLGAGTDENPTGWVGNVPSTNRLVDVPNLSLLGRTDPFGAFGGVGVAGAIGLIMLIFSLLLADFFDTMGTVVAVGQEGDLLDEEGNPPHLREILLVDSLAAIAGGAGSTSSNTSYVESVSGVAEGARTGLASVVTGVAFLLAVFLAPLVNAVPAEAVSPVLVIVGVLMMGSVTQVDWSRVDQALPAFLTIALMPFAYSITVGIGAGFVMYVVMQIAIGKARKVHPLMWVVAAMFVVYFAQGAINGLLS